MLTESTHIKIKLEATDDWQQQSIFTNFGGNSSGSNRQLKQLSLILHPIGRFYRRKRPKWYRRTCPPNLDCSRPSCWQCCIPHSPLHLFRRSQPIPKYHPSSCAERRTRERVAAVEASRPKRNNLSKTNGSMRRLDSSCSPYQACRRCCLTSRRQFWTTST